MEFNDEMKRWQQLRRGRYVEFNLVSYFFLLPFLKILLFPVFLLIYNSNVFYLFCYIHLRFTTEEQSSVS